jgi:hypothetical protein
VLHCLMYVCLRVFLLGFVYCAQLRTLFAYSLFFVNRVEADEDLAVRGMLFFFFPLMCFPKL